MRHDSQFIYSVSQPALKPKDQGGRSHLPLFPLSQQDILRRWRRACLDLGLYRTMEDHRGSNTADFRIYGELNRDRRACALGSS